MSPNLLQPLDSQRRKVDGKVSVRPDGLIQIPHLLVVKMSILVYESIDRISSVTAEEPASFLDLRVRKASDSQGPGSRAIAGRVETSWTTGAPLRNYLGSQWCLTVVDSLLFPQYM